MAALATGNRLPAYVPRAAHPITNPGKDREANATPVAGIRQRLRAEKCSCMMTVNFSMTGVSGHRRHASCTLTDSLSGSGLIDTTQK
jgi:hypothetical protein